MKNQSDYNKRFVNCVYHLLDNNYGRDFIDLCKEYLMSPVVNPNLTERHDAIVEGEKNFIRKMLNCQHDYFIINKEVEDNDGIDS